MSIAPQVIAPVWSEDPLTARTRAVWSGADFLPIAQSFEAGAREFVDRLGVARGEWVLDVACGTGNLAIPAAQAGAIVTGVDIASNLIVVARQQARVAGVDVHFDVGDAEQLPYVTDQFDTVVTMFGAMFAPRPDRAAAELLRVTRRRGRIVMANWTPTGVIGDLLKAHNAVAPRPAGVPSPLEWGQAKLVEDRLGHGASAITSTTRTIELKFDLPPAAVTQLFATHYGPTVAALKVADPVRGNLLREAMTKIFEEGNRATDGTTLLVGEYLEVVVQVA